MTVAIWILSVLSIAEFTFAPVNLWTGRTMPNFTRFTGFSPEIATQLFAPVKLATAAALAAGLVVPAIGLAGAALATGICATYLVRLAAPERRHIDGLAGFVVFGSWALALLILRVVELA
jgi:hypothetical protein